MLFNSQTFIIFFLPAVLGLYYALAAHRAARQALIVLASMVFYGWWDMRFVPLLAGLTVANWLIAQWFGRSRARWDAAGPDASEHPSTGPSPALVGRPIMAGDADVVPGIRPATPKGQRHAHLTQGRWIPVFGVVLNLGVLGLFKYADFLRGTVFDLAGQPWHPWSLVLPLGISFFVFQKISYLIDLKRGDRHIYGFLDFCMFVSFFPQLIAGPLVRHNEIIPQFRADPRGPAMWENLSRGFYLFIVGVTKKVALADTLAMIADPLFQKAAGTSLNAAEAWVAAGAYTLQIYFDFSGYSDMAIGLALMFGLRLPFNFDAPYRAVSIRDFWRRWHMTLSRFLRDYLYIPLGGNRCRPIRQAANVIVTMLLGGLWHGANWTFVVWGGLHGMALAVNHVWEQRGWRLPTIFAWLLTSLFVMACWVLFRSPDFGTAGDILASMLTLHGMGSIVLTRDEAVILLVGAMVAVAGPTSQKAAFTILRPEVWVAVPVGLGLAYLLLLIGGRLPNVFIYFQF